MPKSKKSTAVDADLPAKIEGGYQGTEGLGQPGTPPKGGSAAKRPSRSKAAIAEREAAAKTRQLARAMTGDDQLVATAFTKLAEVVTGPGVDAPRLNLDPNWSMGADGELVANYSDDTAGWAFTSDAFPTEWSTNHPINSGEADEATDIRPCTWGQWKAEGVEYDKARAAYVANEVEAIRQAIASGLVDRETALATASGGVCEAFLADEKATATPPVLDFDAVMARLTAVEHGWSIDPVADHPCLTPVPPHPATDAEIDAAIAALEVDVDQDDPEVVRSLADVDIGAMYAEDDEANVLTVLTNIAYVLGFTKWETAEEAEKILGGLIANHYTPATTAVERTAVAKGLSDAEKSSLAVLWQIRIVLGNAEWACPEHAEQILIELIENHLGPATEAIECADDAQPAESGIEEAALARMQRRGAAFARVTLDEVGSDRWQPSNVVQLPASEDDTYTTLTDQYDKILALEGELIDAKAELQRAEIVAREALRDIGQKKAIIEHQDTVISDLNRLLVKAKAQFAHEEQSHSRTIDQRDDYLYWADKLANAIGGAAVGEHSNANNPWEVGVEIANDLKTELAVEQDHVARLLQTISRLNQANLALASRGPIARLLNRPA